MPGNKPDFEVFVSQDYVGQDGDDKAYYTKVGAAWKVAKDGISIRLQALPVDGDLVLFPAKPD